MSLWCMLGIAWRAFFALRLSDTAEETPRRHNDHKDRSGEQHMCTYNARQARCAASRPTAQRGAAPVGVLCLRHASAGRQNCTQACPPAQTLPQPATMRACASRRAKKSAPRDAQHTPEAHKRLLPSLLLLVTLRLRARVELRLGCEEQYQSITRAIPEQYQSIARANPEQYQSITMPDHAERLEVHVLYRYKMYTMYTDRI